ncbi:MAG: EF-hand domain-containing protein [Pseudomonadota bacterium]
MKRKTGHTLTVLTSVAAAVGFVALSAASADPGERMFDKLDADGDGRVAIEDLADAARTRGQEADADNDGYVTREEMEAHREAKRAEMREKRFPDQNDDGVVSRTEFEDAAAARFAELDKNGDGVLTEDEKPKRRGPRGRF